MSTNTKGTVAVAVDFSEVATLVVEAEEETVEVAAAVEEIVVEAEAVAAPNQESL
jgi:hypothetical protein